MIPEINLLPKRTRTTAGNKWALIGATVLLVVILGIVLYQYFTLTKSIQSLATEQQHAQNEVELLEVTLAELTAVEEVDLSASVQFIERVSYPVSPVILEVNKYLGEHAYLRNYSFSETNVSFSVDFETMSDVATYIESLRESPFFTDVIVNNISSFEAIDSIEDKDPFTTVGRYSNSFDLVLDLQFLRSAGGNR